MNLPTPHRSPRPTWSATLQAGPQIRLTWRDNATNESGFVVERSADGGVTFAQIAVAPARNGTGNVTFTDTTVVAGTSYTYQVKAVNLFGGVTTYSAPSNWASVGTGVTAPAAPSAFNAVNGANQGNKRAVVLTWTDNATNETGFTLQRATNTAFTTGFSSTSLAANTTTLTVGGLNKATTYYFRIRSNNGVDLVRLGQRDPVPDRHQPVTQPIPRRRPPTGARGTLPDGPSHHARAIG